MNTGKLSLQAIPEDGIDLALEDLPEWREALGEFHMDCRFEEPIKAAVFVKPEPEGVLLRGRFAAVVVLPCDRCAEEARYILNEEFAAFEPYPDEETGDDEDRDESIIYQLPRNKGVEVNAAALVWQEFSLALPVKPLCDKMCKGLCPVCGTNRNTEACACEQAGADPRLAPLQRFKPSK